jgi:superfamily I DNA/RNA helicase
MPSTRSSSFVAEPEAEVSGPAFEPSPYQRAIFDWFANPDADNPNLLVTARAGTGKTTTILHAIEVAPEEPILLAAFNKRIQEEMAGRLMNPRAEAMTLHALGYRSLRQEIGYVRTCSGYERQEWLAQQVCGGLPFGAKRLVAKLVTKAREIEPLTATVESLVTMAYAYDIVPRPSEGLSVEQVAVATLRAMKVAATEDPRVTGIDYADMIFLPLVNDWVRPHYMLGVVDEAQDMSLAQLGLFSRLMKPEGRIVIVGDDRQAIYGFRGVDSANMHNLKVQLDAQELNLPRTYRCPKLVVAIAQQLVPDFEVDESAPDGYVDSLKGMTQLVEAASADDFILSRKNAPLVRVALACLRAGKPARIQGRDIGQMLKTLVRKIAVGNASYSIPMFIMRLRGYEEKQIERLKQAKKLTMVDELVDKCDTLYWLAKDSKSVPALLTNIDNLFTDEPGETIICSSVHKAKGLEADTVFLLMSSFGVTDERGNYGRRAEWSEDYEQKPLPPDRAEEEANIFYVAVTRAKRRLVRCNGEF